MERFFSLETSIIHKIILLDSESSRKLEPHQPRQHFSEQGIFNHFGKICSPKHALSFYWSFQEEELVGIALSQFLDLNQMESFGERDKCLKTAVRNTIFKNFCSHILIMGNNMLTGQNAFTFLDKIDKIQGLKALRTASKKLETIFKNKGLKVHITTFKDFPTEDTTAFQEAGFQNHFQYSTQPNTCRSTSRITGSRSKITSIPCPKNIETNTNAPEKKPRVLKKRKCTWTTSSSMKTPFMICIIM